MGVKPGGPEPGNARPGARAGGYLPVVGRLGFRTPRDIAAGARWTAAEPPGRAYVATRVAAWAAGWWAVDRWGLLVGGLVLSGALVVAGRLARDPRQADRDAPPPERPWEKDAPTTSAGAVTPREGSQAP